jgi:protein-disulfide isomerase
MSTLRRPVGPDDHVQGSREAPVLLVEYGDFECPFCGAAHGEVRRLQQLLGDRLGFVFRNFPLTQSHAHAQQAAEAAEAAGAQGRYWEMHDILFEHQQALEPEDLVSYAGLLQLDVRQFERDLDQHRFAERVRDDFMDGIRSGVNGTPTFFINGVRHDGSPTFDGLLARIERGQSAHY